VDDTKLLEFPCRFPIKAFGEKGTGFEELLLGLVGKHVPELGRDDLTRNVSRNGRYVSITAHITAQSQQQLDAIYQDLSDHDAVLMAL